MSPHEIGTIGGVRLPVDAAGRVDLSAVDRHGKSTGRSPSEWARTRRFTDLLKRLQSRTGLPKEDLWVVRGTTKAARTWAHPVLAEAYLQELGFVP